MKQQDIKRNLRQAIYKTAPPKIRTAINITPEPIRNPMQNTRKLILSFISVFAILLSIFTYTATQSKVMAYVTIDIDPTLQLKINDRNQVLETIAIDANGTTILATLNLKGKDLNEALSQLIDVLINEGYLSSTSNSLLLSIDVKDDSDPEALTNSITNDVATILQSKAINPNIVASATPRSTSTNNISSGKLNLMKALVKADPTLTLTNLSKLNIHELMILATSKKVSYSGVTVIGQADQTNYITQDEAIAIALQQAGLTLDQVKAIEAELETEDGTMIYEVELTADNQEIKYFIDALRGAIITDKDEIDDDDEKDEDEIDDEEDEDEVDDNEEDEDEIDDNEADEEESED